MDHKKYRKALAQLDLTQAAAGEMFGVGARTSRRWASGDAKVPPTVAMLLELMISKRVKLELNIPVSAERPQAERRVWTFQAKQAVHAME
jgi:transcriptional regulator with XRE-family HTH domain